MDCSGLLFRAVSKQRLIPPFFFFFSFELKKKEIIFVFLSGRPFVSVFNYRVHYVEVPLAVFHLSFAT